MPDIDNNETALWVRSAQGNSPEAFHHLHRRFVALVHGILLSRFRPAIAEELTQECFLIAFQKLHQLRDPAKFGPWIVMIARRLDAPVERFEQIDASANDAADLHDNPEFSADAAKVLAVIRSLTLAYRETLVLRLVEGMSATEIASATGMSPDSVRVNLHRGMKKLRAALGIDANATYEVGEQQ